MVNNPQQELYGVAGPRGTLVYLSYKDKKDHHLKKATIQVRQ